MSSQDSSADQIIDADVFQQTLPFVFKYFRLKDLLNIRPVSKEWNSLVLKDRDRVSGKLIFRVCNNPLCIDAFRNLSESFEVKHFRFESMDLEADIFGNSEIFRRFSMGHCLGMISLAIRDCYLSTGRFFELLAFCKNLKNLTLLDVPSIYQIENGIGIFHWAFCFKYMRENLEKVETLSISETTGLSNQDVWGLASGIRNLKELHIGSDSSIHLPIHGINEILKRSSHSLRLLVLRGSITSPGLELGPDVEMKDLRKLVLLLSECDGERIKQVQNFLEKCPKLETLCIEHCNLDKSTFSSAQIQKTLTYFGLYSCTLDAKTFGNAEFESLKVLTVRMPVYTENTNANSAGVISLLKCKKPKVSTLQLELPGDGATYLQYLDVKNYSNLTSLSLINCVDIAGRALRKIFKDFTTLLSLSIDNCQELNDDNVCCLPNSDAQESLANLENLQTLSLVRTGVGNQTIQTCIIKMKNLELIRLDNTKVDYEGVRTIMSTVKTTLSSLKTLSVKHCKIARQEFIKWVRLAPSVTVECCIIASGVEIEYSNANC